MTEIGVLQVLLYLIILLIMVKPLGWYMARIYNGQPGGLNIIFLPIEKYIYRIAGIHPEQEMNWQTYLLAMLVFNLFGCLFLYAIQRLQIFLPLNPQHFSSVKPDLAFNTAISFVTNTNWQAYSGETTMSYFSQLLGLTTQNFLSAATGLSLFIALARGLKRSETNLLGNFWVDLVRGLLYILLPLSFVFAIVLISQGVMQNFKPYQQVNLIQAFSYPTTKDQDISIEKTTSTASVISQQIIPMGPVASQVAIKQLGTNGGGFFNTNSSHPFENPTPLTNFLEMLAILLIPAALCYTFGIMISDKRQGWAVLLAMLIIFIPLTLTTIMAEQKGNNLLTQLSVNQLPLKDIFPGGNMEGKETRFGIVNSALWASATTATSNGSVNAMFDSFTPIGGLMPLWLMQLGEIIFGGVGSGLLGMVMLIIITVFVAGLMIGRTPEYLGKKIESYEMKMAAFAVLIMPVLVLVCTALAVIAPTATKAITNPTAHGFSEILYAFTSMANNNGSALAGLNADNSFYNILGGMVMLIGRFWFVIATLAIAGSLAQKKIIPSNAGTLSTHTPLFVTLLIGITLILGALAFLPALALGPLIEQLLLWGMHVH